MVHRVIHTDMPLAPLSLLVGEYARVEQGRAAGARADCFYGWGEAMADPIGCKPHHLVFTPDEDMRAAIVGTLYEMGYQVVTTDYDEWSEHQVVLRYDHDHQH